jgi:hypothetical protein
LFVDGQHFQSVEPLARQLKRGQMECVERAQASGRSDDARELTDLAPEFPNLAAAPNSIQRTSSIGELSLSGSTENPKANDGTRGFDEG